GTGDDGDRAIRAVVRDEFVHDAVDLLDGEVEDEGCLRSAEGREVLPGWHRARAAGDAGQDDGLADLGDCQFAGEGCCRGGVGGYSGRHVVRDVQGVEAA